MRVVVIGATGNVGTSVLESLEAESAVHDVVAVARRAPSRAFARTTFVAADVASFDLVPLLRGADAVVHLAWLIQPGRSESITHSVNVAGSERALLSDARGAFNLAADPPIDRAELARVLHARPLKVSRRVFRAGAAATFALRLQPSEPGWLDMAFAVPLLDCTRARFELGWEPRRAATDALTELIEAMRRGTDYPTPPLARATSGPLRIRELTTGVGARP